MYFKKIRALSNTNAKHMLTHAHICTPALYTLWHSCMRIYTYISCKYLHTHTCRCLENCDMKLSPHKWNPIGLLLCVLSIVCKNQLFHEAINFCLSFLWYRSICSWKQWHVGFFVLLWELITCRAYLIIAYVIKLEMSYKRLTLLTCI